MPDKSPFSFFARAVEGHIVSRYGTRQPLGVTADGEGRVVWDTTKIHALTEGEMAQYGREYRRAVEDGAIKPAKREEWEAQQRAAKVKAEEAREFFQHVRTTHGDKLKASFPEREPTDITDDDIFAWAQAGGVPLKPAAPEPAASDPAARRRKEST